MAVNGERGAAPDESRIRELYRDASTQEPPARVDAAIRAAAHEALAPRAPRAAWWVPWRVPFALAAVAVISVSLATLVMEEKGERIGDVSQRMPAAPEQGARIAEVAPVTPPAQPNPGAETDAHSPRAKAPLARPAEPTAGETRATQESVSPAAVAESPRPASAPPVAAVPASPQLGAAADTADARTSANAAARESAAVLSAKPAARRADAAQAQSGAGPDVQPFKVELEGRPPADWIERIVRLRREGRQPEADALLAEFRRRFPGEAVPSSLD